MRCRAHRGGVIRFPSYLYSMNARLTLDTPTAERAERLMTDAADHAGMRLSAALRPLGTDVVDAALVVAAGLAVLGACILVAAMVRGAG